MEKSNQNSGDHEDDTGLDIKGIEDSIHPGSEAVDLILEPESRSQDGLDTEGEIFPEFIYIEDDESRTSFDFKSIRDCSNSQPKTTEVPFEDSEPS
ncbi:MAG: hypothetical protein OER98_12910 [Gammaproteobacteria bacterium]|nr:hypothetical protein [Gammaproteobacteria bacterium]